MTVDEAIDLAVGYQQRGQLAEAERLYQAVLNTVPGHPVVLHNLGLMAHQVGKYEMAVELMEKSVAGRPVASSYSNLAEVYRQVGKLAEAEQAGRRAIELDAGHAAAYSNLGLVLQELRRFAEAEEILQKAVRLDPQAAAGWQNLCNTLGDLGRTAEAVEAGRRAVKLSPGVASTWSDLAVACVENGDVGEALTAFERSIAIEPARGDSRHNYACLLLMTGDFARGWKEYEWRWKCENFPSPIRNFREPMWDGSALEGKTILLHAEQGLGDAIMFARFIPRVMGMGGKVIVECDKELVGLLAPMVGEGRVVGRFAGELPGFDVHCPFMSLPLVLGVDAVEKIPAEVPYLRAEEGLRERWKERLSGESRLKVGIVWAGRASHRYDRNRSVTVGHFAPLAEVEGVALYSLQVGREWSLPGGMTIVDLSGELTDYAQTAAAIENLDLVISVDTSVAHMAGALGKPVWTLLAYAGEWRWIWGRGDSPWYPTMRLFRQERPGEWGGVFSRVGEALREKVFMG